MPYVPTDKLRLWVGLVLGGSLATFWAVWTALTTFGPLPDTWNRFGALGLVADVTIVVGFGAVGLWALAYGLLIRKKYPTVIRWAGLRDAKTK